MKNVHYSSQHSTRVFEWVCAIFHQVMNVNEEEVRNGIDLIEFLISLMNNSSTHNEKTHVFRYILYSNENDKHFLFQLLHLVPHS